MWNFQNFSATQILREINLEDWRGSKTAIFADSEALIFFLAYFSPQKLQKIIKNLTLNLNIVKMAIS